MPGGVRGSRFGPGPTRLDPSGSPRVDCIAVVLRRLLGLALSSATIAGCGEPKSAPADTHRVDDAAPLREPPEVEFSGCQSTRREPLTCFLRTATTDLHLWVESRQIPALSIDGVPVNAQVSPSAGEPGWTIQVEAPRTARLLEVRTDPDAHPFTLVLDSTPPTPTVEAVELELAPRGSSLGADFPAALAKLDAAASAMSTYERVVAGRVRMLLRRDLGETAGALAEGQASLDLALANGFHGEAVDIAQILTHLRRQAGETASAQLLVDLQGLYIGVGADAAQRAQWHYYRGVGALADGDSRTALGELEAAEAGARRLGLVAEELSAASLRAGLLGQVGRHADRDRSVDRILELTTKMPIAERCVSANVLYNAGWAVLLGRAHGSGQDRAAALFEAALAMYAPRGGCEVGGNADWARDLQETRINYALEAVMRADWPTTELRARMIDQRALQPGQALWFRYIQGELAMAHGDPARAVRVLSGVGASDDVLVSWQAMVTRGRALEALGRAGQALASYEGAEALLDAAVLRLGVDQGREGLVAGMHSSASELVRLRLERGETKLAIEAARRSRTRALRPVGRGAALAGLTPEQRSNWDAELVSYAELARTVEKDLTDLWRLPQDDRDERLRSHVVLRREMQSHLDAAYSVLATSAAAEPPSGRPSPGESWLLYHPIRDGWAGFAISHDEERGGRLERITPGASAEELGVILLEPFAGTIDAADSINVLAMGELDELAFHMLPWHDEPLLVAKPISYQLDIGGARRDFTPRDARSALVVADPASQGLGLGSLPRALQEGEDVSAALRGAGWDVRALASADARYADVAKQLAVVDWFHYAGHAVSAEGWDSALPLAGDALLGIRDILAMPRVPGAIVLSGCKTGTFQRRRASGGQHLANAFLLAGAQFVIATSADLPDAFGMRFARELYRTVLERHERLGAQLLRRTLLRLDDDVERTHWGSFRTWIP